MVAIDTNIAVRLLMNDDPELTGKAAALFKAHEISAGMEPIKSRNTPMT